MDTGIIFPLSIVKCKSVYKSSLMKVLIILGANFNL